MDKTVWVVKGSEDGILGVYTTMKRAIDKINWYINLNGGDKKAKIVNSCYVYGENQEANINAEAEKFFLNN